MKCVCVDGNEAVRSLSALPIVAHYTVSHRGTSENLNVSRIQLHCTLEVPHRFMPTVLPAVNVSTPFKNSRVVGQGAGGDGELVTGVVVIKVAMVKMPSQGKVCASRIWFQSKSGIYCSIRQLQTAGRVIAVLEIELIVCLSQPAICEKKSWIPGDRSVE